MANDDKYDFVRYEPALLARTLVNKLTDKELDLLTNKELWTELAKVGDEFVTKGGHVPFDSTALMHFEEVLEKIEVILNEKMNISHRGQRITFEALESPRKYHYVVEIPYPLSEEEDDKGVW